MRNSKHYIQARVSPSEKDHFLRVTELCNMTEHTVLDHYLEGYPLAEHPPEEFWELDRLLLRITLLLSHVWLSKNMRLEKQQNKYYTAQKQLNKLCNNAFWKIKLADPDYGNDSNDKRKG